MKSATRRTTAQPAPLATLRKVERASSSSLSAITKGGSTLPQVRSSLRTKGLRKLKTEAHQQYLSKSLEKTFLRMKTSRAARDAYVRAEVTTAVAHQIRALRVQRGWSQKELADQLNTSQAVVSRLEDPSYGRLSLNTLFDLSHAFDTGLSVCFESLVTMLQKTYRPSAEHRLVPRFDEESSSVSFFSENLPSHLVVEFASAHPLPETLEVTSSHWESILRPAATLHFNATLSEGSRPFAGISLDNEFVDNSGFITRTKTPE